MAVGLVEQAARQRRAPARGRGAAASRCRAVEARAGRRADRAPRSSDGVSASSESRKPKRIGRPGRREQAVALPGIGLAQAEQVGEGRRDVEQGGRNVVRPGRQPRMRRR